jgi:DNA-directed RNA polymerase specialized sigma24 family protein
MTEPLRRKGLQERLLAERSHIPSGVMQAVLMHGLQLRRSYREVFLLCEIQGLSVGEAAVILGISRSAAKRRLTVAHRRMDEVIERLCERVGSEPVS